MAFKLARIGIRGISGSTARLRINTNNSVDTQLKDEPKKKKNLDNVVYMSQVSYDISRDQILDIFKRYGPISEVHLPMTKGKGHAKGYGRIVFDDKNNARRAAVQMQSYVINNMPIKLTLGTDLEKKKAITKSYDVVMIKNLAYDVEEEDIMKILRPYQALRIGLIRAPMKNICLGYGYVRFASSNAAIKALEELKNFSIKGRKVRMHMAEPKDHHYSFAV